MPVCTGFRPPRLALLVLAALAALPARAAGEDLGRLFYTPEQRRQLDHLRRLGAAPGQPLEARPVLRLDGVVRHPDGRVTTWINGQPTQGGPARAGEPVGQARVPADSGRSVPLGVGDRLPAGGSAPETLLGDGHIRRNPARP